MHTSAVAVRGAWWKLARPGARRPIFIVACPRSGASLVYRALAEMDGLGATGVDSRALWESRKPCAGRQWRDQALDACDADAADRQHATRHFFVHTGHSRWVDHCAHGGLMVRYLDALFPDAHFVHVKRAPSATLRSLMSGWGRPEMFGETFRHLPAKIRVDGGRYRQWCFALPTGWPDYLHAALEEVCAFQYVAIQRAILDARISIPAERWSEVPYEALMQAPQATLERLFNACDAGTEAGARRAIAQVEKRMHAYAAARAAAGRDQRAAQRVAAVWSRVSEIGSRLGYDMRAGPGQETVLVSRPSRSG